MANEATIRIWGQLIGFIYEVKNIDKNVKFTKAMVN
jgi:hypothetical protein